MMALGAALLATAAIAVASGVRNAHRDAAARDRWIAEGRPTWAFRPTRHGGHVDVLAIGGALAGLALVATGLASRRNRTRSSLHIGRNDDAADRGTASTSLTAARCASDGLGGFVANLTGLTGDVQHGARVTPIAELLAAGHVEIPMTLETHVRARVGASTFHLRGIEAERPAMVPPGFSIERKPLAFVAASAVLHLGLIALVGSLPPDQGTAAIDHDLAETTGVVARLLSSDDPPPDEPEVDDGDATGEAGAASTSVAMALTDGTLGTTEPNANPAKLQVKDRGLAEQLARDQAIEMARDAGILGGIDSPIAVYQGGDLASGFDDLDITGGLFDGGGHGPPAGSFGWGVRGMNQGCGRTDGKPCGGVKSGPFATTGWKGDREHLSMKNRPGTDELGRHRPVLPPVKPGRPECVGETCLDRDLIRRYVTRNLEKVSYCYEKELLARPALEGTVTAFFTLDGNGAVIESKASGVDPTVSSCIARVMSNIKFPKVGPAGIYPIKYPFKLHPSGA